MTEPEAVVSKRERRISPIWIIPIVAILLGVWMIFYTIASEGPTVRLRMPTAEGIEAGKTKIRARSVEVGVVQDVLLNDVDMNGRRIMSTQTMEEQVRPAMETINEIAAYYGSDALFDAETMERLDRPARRR